MLEAARKGCFFGWTEAVNANSLRCESIQMRIDKKRAEAGRSARMQAKKSNDYNTRKYEFGHCVRRGN